MLQKLKQRNEGFTIIEVLIVLAIAGLILLVVFLAVPALQRNSRNSQRKRDVASVLGAVNEYQSNNAGGFPANGNLDTAYPNNKPNYGYYTGANVAWVKRTTAGVVADPNDLDKINVANFSKCNGNASTATGATTRSVAAVYDIEGSGGTLVAQCVES